MRFQKHRKTIGIIAALVFTLVAIIAFGLFSSPNNLPDPVHRGKKASQWIAALDSQYGAEHAKAALVEMGSDCVPQLAHYLKISASPLASSLRYRNFRIALTRWLKAPSYDPPSQTSRTSIMKLAPKLGDNAKDLVPQLTASAKENKSSVHHFAIQSLGQMGSIASNAVPSLMKGLDSTDHVTTRVTVLALTRIGTLNQEQVTRIKRLRDHNNLFVSSFATIANWKFTKTPESAAEVERLLKHADEELRWVTIQMITTIGVEKALLIPLLDAKRSDQNETDKVRAAATTALEALQ